MKTFYLTKSGLKKIQHEFVYLQEEIKKVNKKIGETVSLDNDLRENPEFMSLRTKAEYEIPNKIKCINDILNNYMLIENLEYIVNGDEDVVGIGHEVALINQHNESRKITILGLGDSEIGKGIVSYEAPIAKLLIDKEVGDFVELPSSSGKQEYEIVKIIKSKYLKG